MFQLENRAVRWWAKQFPESLYPCIFEKDTEYKERVFTGHHIASHSNVIIAGLCRDNESILPSTLLRMEALADLFFDATICIFENDSTDLTPDILRVWSVNTKIENQIRLTKFNRPKFGSVKSKERIEGMSFVRTKLQKLVEQTAFEMENDGCKPDYVILLDMDIEGFSYEGILNSLSYNFDCVGSNGLIYTKDEEKYNRHYFDSYGSKFIPEKTDEEKNLTLLHRGESPIKVESAFGGLSVYKAEAYLNGKYSVGDWARYCEHIPFHSSMDCYLNPSQITLYNKTRYSL